MKRVLQVFDSLEISGGVQAVVMNTYRRMDKDLVQFDFAVYDAPKLNSYQDEIEGMGGRVYKVDNVSTAGPVGFYSQFRRLFTSIAYDAVHAHNLHHNGLILLAAKRAGVPIRISHSHQSYDERNASLPRRAFAGGLGMLNQRVATRRVACSDLAGEFLYGKTPFEILPNAIDLNKFDTEESKEELRRRYGYDLNQKLLLHVGRFCAPKNQSFLVEVMDALGDEGYTLLVAGEGPTMSDFEKLVRERQLQGCIECLGLRTDVPELLMVADFLLLPSLHEGLPVVVVEAQAAGCMSLVSNVVTRQVDLGVGLVDYLSPDCPGSWVERIRKQEMPRTVSREKVHGKMREMRFDVQSNLDAWYGLYACGV